MDRSRVEVACQLADMEQGELEDALLSCQSDQWRRAVKRAMAGSSALTYDEYVREIADCLEPRGFSNRSVPILPHI